MFTTTEVFLYIYFPSICLIYLVAWWIYRRNRAQKPPDLLPAQRKNPYPRLRALALHSGRIPKSMPKPSSPAEPWGVVMDWVVSAGVATVVAFSDGSASVYFSSGGGLLGGQAHEPIRNAARDAVGVAAEFQPQMELTTVFPLPQPGIVVFYVLADSGVFTSSAFESALKTHSHALSKLGDAMQAIISAYRGIPEAN
jgi:hypothetical protein